MNSSARPQLFYVLLAVDVAIRPGTGRLVDRCEIRIDVAALPVRLSHGVTDEG